ncbi:MAG: cytochrome c oxidase subunit II [Alphaproteobacteria bacterium]|nr:MAG: cytochrome c oxidase subunit II [Alphaproteobacteria bacterium]
MRVMNWVGLCVLGIALTAAFGVDMAFASEPTYGQPVDNQLSLQLAASPVMKQTSDLYHGLLIAMTAVCIFVGALMVYVIVKFNAKANPTPSKTSHNTAIEVVWTIIPIIILIVIFVPSYRLLAKQETIPEADLTIKIIGQQWYWDYEYPDHGDFAFSSTMVEEEDLVEGQPRLLATDEPIYVPVNANVRILVTAGDVIHAWTIPSFGVKMDAVPGRVNEAWFRAEREGIFYGQCSELCGARHAFMPIEVHVVSQEEFDTWVAYMQDEYGALETDTNIRLASAVAQ